MNATSVPPELFEALDTSLPLQIVFARRFLRRFGIRPDQLDGYAWPEVLPFKNALIACDIPGMTVSALCKCALDTQLVRWRMDLSESELGEGAHPPGRLRVFIMENTLQPSTHFSGISTRLNGATTHPEQFLDLRSYIFAFGLVYNSTLTYMDRTSATWFPQIRCKEDSETVIGVGAEFECFMDGFLRIGSIQFDTNVGVRPVIEVHPI